MSAQPPMGRLAAGRDDGIESVDGQGATRMIASVKDRQAALVRRMPIWSPRTLDQMLDAAAAEFPDRPYVVSDAGAWSYAQIRLRSELIAQGLAQAGVRAGDHVALLMANYPEFVAAKFAIARVGAACVPVNFLNRRDELGFVLRQSEAKVLITMDRFRNLDYLGFLDELAPGWETLGGGDGLPALRQVVVFPTTGSPVRDGAMAFAALETHGAAWRPLDGRDPSAMSDMIFTSGTTGSPKGVMLSHDMVLRAACASAYSRAFDDHWRILFSLPMYHVYGYVEGMLSALFVGGAIIPQLQFDPAATLAAISRHGATDILLVPTMTLALLDELRQRHYDVSPLKAMLSSGQRSPPTIWQDIRSHFGPVELTTGYGMTEVTATTTLTRPEDPFERLLTGNGRMRDAGPPGDRTLGGRLVEYRVVDPETGRLLGTGEVGELMARGPGVTAGYYKHPDATAEAFDADGWLRSGDLGRFDDDGYLTLVGRRKEAYRCGGEQVMPSEVEDILVSHPAVLQAHVVPVPDRKMGEAGAAYVVLRPEPAVSAQELIDLCAGRLARFKVPKYVLPIKAEDLPVTPSGRARKFLLSERAIRELSLS
ncbi:MAG: AMP-binding protein [Hyphomicrobiales bacterium]|nr:AMP-binding protein [Hyphomicrobiales bacterium]